MIDLNNNRFVVFGFRNRHDTFGHIQEALFRALQFKFPDREVYWVDSMNPEDANFENALVLTVNVADLKGLPKRKDAFYVVHNTDDRVKAFFGDMRQYSCMNYGMYTSTTNLGQDDVEVGYETYLNLQRHEAYSCMIWRWGTDLFPHEIQANKPDRVWNPDSKEINFVGTIYENVHGPFKRACEENGLRFNAYGGFTAPPVSIEENIRLVKASRIACAVGDDYHRKVGYFPCRLYKCLSYGCMPLINNDYAQAAFKNRLINNQDTYKLFYDAKEQLPKIELSVLHDLMDEVAKYHTYVTKLDSLLTAVRITQESR